METNTHERGIALLLDRDGVIRDVLAEEALLEGAVPGVELAALAAPGSEEALRGFVAAVWERGAAFGRVMDVGGRRVQLSGVRREDGVYVVGVVSTDVYAYYHKLLEAHTEQVNRHRGAMKEEQLRRRAQHERQVTLLDDITRLNNELVSAQRELAGKNAALQRLDEQKNRFLGMATHDLRSPLSSIIMYTDAFLESGEGALSDEQHALVARMRRAAEHMLDLVDDFLDVASIEAGRLRLRFQEVDLKDLVARNVAANRAWAARKDIDIELHAEQALPRIVADPGKVEQVVNNLISNAVKYSPRKARVEVSLRRRGEHVAIAVADTGPGIPPDQQDRLFQPFERTSRPGTAGEKGTGLGLVIVGKIVEGHGGSVRVESEARHGSTFTVLLPIRQAEAAGASPADG